jgi:flagellar motor switch protein FliM
LSDVLSQNEIDDLLNALSTGEVDVHEIEDETKEKKVKKYDFRRPDKFAKDQLRTLEIIHENFSRQLNNFLSGYLRTYIEVEVLSTQGMTYNEFSNSISNPAILGIINFAPLDGQIIIDVSYDIAFAMIERVLGGAGKNSNLKEARSLTEIEMVLLKNILMKFINLMRESWSNIIELKPKLENIETNSQFAQIVSPSESIALITFNLKVGDSEGMINICIPHFVIEPILPNLSSKLWFSGSMKKDITEPEYEALKMGIGKTSLEVKTVVGRTVVSVQEFLSLNIGDVLILSKEVEGELEVYVENDLKYYGRPGVSKNKLAVMITASAQEEDEFYG